MIFVGFGFLMTFMRRYGFGSVGFNFLLSVLTIQWAILTNAIIIGSVTTTLSRLNHARHSENQKRQAIEEMKASMQVAT